MKVRVTLDLNRGVANFFNGSKMLGSTIHRFTGDDWKTIDTGKIEMASNLWQRDGAWVISVYPIDPRTGYIKLNRPYEVELTLSGAITPVAA
ncbi:MAG: hypothetical protein MUC38_13455 [Cyclobacteriaceae bacterium]|jgi:hypothetical protein|nr:hypothetical protein [Cyclobacteriaceae bacterium]